MTGWYTLTPSGAVAIGNLTPIGQNSGQVGCRWPPNGHHLAACLNIPGHCQIYGPFWHCHKNPEQIYLPLPQTTYCLTKEEPQEIFRSQWNDQHQSWQVQPEHQDKLSAVRFIGGEYLIAGNVFEWFWQDGFTRIKSPLSLIPLDQVWQSLVLTHNSRDNYLVKDEAGFFAEMATLLQPGWSILVKVLTSDHNKNYTPPQWSCLGAGSIPVAITAIPDIEDQWLTPNLKQPKGAVLLTGALWKIDRDRISFPYPCLESPHSIKAYAASEAVPWQSLVKKGQPFQRLTPGEWLTPAGAVYLWSGESPTTESIPFRDRYHRDALGYGHLWLFE